MSDPTQFHPTTLVGQADRLEEQLGRADHKASLLLGLFGVLGAYLADLAGRTSDRPAASVLVLWAAVLAFVAASFLVALAIRPSMDLPSGRPYGYMAYVQCSPGPELHQAIADTHTEEALEHRLIDLSWVAYRRNRRVRTAIALAFYGLGLAVVAAALNAVLS